MRITAPALLIVGLSTAACDELQMMPTPAAASVEECAAMMLVATEALKLQKRGLVVLDGVTRFDWTPAGCDWASANLAFRDFRSPGYSYANIGNYAPEINFAQPKITPEGIIVQVAETDDFEEKIVTCRVTQYRSKLFLGKCDEHLADPMDKAVVLDAIGDKLLKRSRN